MPTPFQERSQCETASYPRVRRAFTGKAPCSALSSWRLTTSGSALTNQAKRLSSRLLMLLMLKVATLTKSFLSLWVRLPKRSTEFVVPAGNYFTGGKKWARFLYWITEGLPVILRSSALLGVEIKDDQTTARPPQPFSGYTHKFLRANCGS